MISPKNTPFFLTVLLASLMILTSCDDQLSEDPKSQLDAAEAYNTIERLQNNAVLNVYNFIGGHEKSQGLQGTTHGVYDLNSLTTDEQLIPIRGGDWYDGGLWKRLFFHQWTAGDGLLKDTWDYLFKMVILCNEGLEHIEAFRTEDYYELLELQEYKAELRALRAMYYFYLMDLYGRVPLVTTTGIRSSEMTLCERQELFYWIYDELNGALPHLRVDWSQYPKTGYYGRMTAYVAYFVMMKLALNAEIYTDNDWTDEVYPDGKDIKLTTYECFLAQDETHNAWETVLLIKSLFESNYSLTEFYDSNFDVNNETSCENIFTIPCDPNLYTNQYKYFVRSRHYCHGAALGGTAENGTCATVTTMKTFGYTGADSSVVDLRFYANFYVDGMFVNDKPVYDYDGVTPLAYQPLAVTDFDLSGKPYEKTAGARLAKYSIEATQRGDGRLGNNDIVLFRYADVLLMAAEAAYRLGDKKQALDDLNLVYERSNDSLLPDVDEEVLLSERLRELMWEGWRRNDLIRFRRYHLSYDLKTDAHHETDGHTTVFPIPADMMTMHPGWKQNPGY